MNLLAVLEFNHEYTNSPRLATLNLMTLTVKYYDRQLHRRHAFFIQSVKSVVFKESPCPNAVSSKKPSR